MLDVCLTSGRIGHRTYSGHYAQLYTGFALLAKQKVVRLQHRLGGTGLLADVNGLKLFYDVLDGPDFVPLMLEDVDYYFKRSLSREYLATPHANNVYALGLNYNVYPDTADWAEVLRGLVMGTSFSQRFGPLMRRLKVSRTFWPTVSAMQAHPSDLEPRVLYLTRTWETVNKGDFDVPDAMELNQMRADCIDALRTRFGSRALAGFSPSARVEKQYPSLLAPVSTEKGNYFDLLKRYPICVATTGLYGSAGWKLGEYVTFGKAIVSEPLFCEVPYLHAGQNYLEFRSVDQCVEAVGQLFESREMRLQMAARNQAYYEAWLRPDQLVLRTLKIALGEVLEPETLTPS